MEDDSDPLMFNYGEPELLSSEARNFYQALKLLGDDWTAEEFALQVFDNGIRLFENNRAEKLKPITNIAAALLWSHGEAEKLSGESYPIEDILLNFKYSEPELSQFKPAYRYISFDKAREIVARSIGDIEKAERFLMNRLNRCDIHAYHPFYGLVKPEQSMNGELWRAGYFPEWKLNQLIADEFGEISNRTTETVNGVALQEDWSADINYGKTLSLFELMNRWGNNFELINDFALDEKILPFLDGKAAYVCKLNGDRAFLFPQMATDKNPYIVENIEDYPSYTKLPDDTRFYLTDISRFEENNPKFKKQVLELERERAKNEQTENKGNDGVVSKTKSQQSTKESQLHKLIWRVYLHLSKNKKTKAQEVWLEIQHRHEAYDTDKIIEEVDAKQILWCSCYRNEQKLKRTSFDKTLSILKSTPPF